MATNRSRRLRKKLCVDEFQELGFEINLTYREGIESKAVDDFLEAFISEAMEANELGYIGGEDYGFVCLARRGSVTEEQRAKVDAWLKARGVGDPKAATARVARHIFKHGTKAHPFWEPAFEEAEPKMRQIIDRYVQRGIEKVFA